MSPEVVDALVRLVANGRRFGVADTVIIEHLVEMGVPQEHAQDLLSEITDGLQEGRGDHHGEPATASSASPLYLAAVAEGKRNRATRLRQSRQSSIVAMVVVVVVAVVVFWFTR